MPSEFVHLHVHTEYSLLDGQSQIEPLMQRARELEQSALAITDHGVMFGAIDFFRAAQSAGIKPIIGMEAYLAPRRMTDKDAALDKKPYHLLLLAQTMQGYLNLCKLASEAQLNGYYYRPRVDKDLLAAHAGGIIATTGCLAAEIPRLLDEGREDKAREMLGWYYEVFGADNFYLELQNHDIEQLDVLNRWLYEYRRSGHTPLKLLATNDVHYVRQDDWDNHDTLLCIQTGALKTEKNRMTLEPFGSYYLKSAAEMRRDFKDAPPDMIDEALASTLEVAARCDVNLNTKGYHLPVFPVPEGFTSTTYLRLLCEMGLPWRYPGREHDPQLRARLERELTIIDTMGFNTYFLIVWDLCEFARSADIWWNVRGSGAGSLVAYCLGITGIDPIQNSLLFERFLNPGRVSMPDIDLDYPDNQRGRMIAYATEKYGEDKVAAIITFGTMGAKASVKDVGRALGVDLSRVNKAASLIPQEAKQKPLREYIDASPDLKAYYEQDADIRRVLDTAIALQGMTRHASMHAAGVIISDQPLEAYLPLHRITGSTDASDGILKRVTQFPMETAESIGLLKVDFLGLSTLAILRKACELIAQHRGIRYTMDNIPYRHDDPRITAEQQAMLDKTFEMLGRGETVGVFQLESGGMQQMLRGMRPFKFEHIIAAVSLYRPGPMDFIPTFNRRMHGEESVTYLHPALEPILGETYAICITGDTLVLDAVTGRRWRVDALADRAGEFIIQGVDADGQPVKRTVSHWYDNGEKAVLRLTLRNGASLKATPEHRFLTERGWVMLQDLQPGDYVATPPALLAPAAPTTFDRRKLRVLAYLIADGGVSNLAQVNFFSKDPALLDDYTRCLAAFPDVAVRQVEQVRGVRRIATRHKDGRRVTSLLAWMREIGFKNPPGMKGGLHSHEKFVPDFVFTLSNEDIVYFLASLWDCDGYADNELWHYRTISAQLARDIQTLLLRLGIAATIDSSAYVNPRRGSRTAYQVTVYSTARLAALLQPHMLTHKRLIQCQHHSSSTIRRDDFLAEVRATTTRSAQALMQAYGIDSQHFYATRRDSPRIHVAKVQNIAAGLPLPRTQIHLRLHWEPIKSIEPAGVERVYDLTVEDIHNFVANNIIVHNCVYQEQIMQIASDLFGYSLGEADLMRRAVSKKKEKDLLQHKAIFKERGPSHGVDVETAEKIFDEIEFFANYGFNKSHATDYAWVTLQTAYLKTHYPEEYMTALLCIQFDDSDKVATFLEECRRLHIPVLPPDVNYSMVEFDIEVTPAGQRAIRFGMGAIKHAGVGVVQLIIDERQRGGPFATLEEFCLRLDLRAVGKRALESLIKVGALVSLHPERDALLAALDRLLSFSHDYHEDKKRGQKSLFGEQSAFAGHLEIPRLPPDKRARPREQLIWEKELLGLYVTGRPIDNFGDLERLRQAGFNQIVRLKEVLNDDASKRSAHGQKVRVAGEVVSLRKLQTKNNDSMCVFLLEDWHESAGVIEVVLFPKTWASLQAYFRSLPAPTEGTEREFGPGEIVIVDGELDTARDSVQIKANHVSTNFDVVTAAPMPELSPYLPDERQMAIGMDEDGNPIYAEAVFPGEELPPQNGYAPEYRPGSRPRTAADLEFLGEKALSATRHLRLYLRRSEDVDKDRRRLRRLHGILTQYPGDDHFSFVIQGGGQKHITMNFPNHTTRYCRALLDELADEVGEDSIVIR